MIKLEISHGPIPYHRPAYRYNNRGYVNKSVVRCKFCDVKCADEVTRIIHQMYCFGEQPEELPPPRHTGERLDETGLRIFHYEKPRGA